MKSRGIRNNNPGNVRHSKTKWQGMADDQPDKDFVSFKSPEYGIRAIAKILLQYQKRGVDTVGEIINTYAPPSENNTDAYIKAVCRKCGVLPDDIIDLDDVAIMLPLVKAIIAHENGSQPYTDRQIEDGLRLAGIVGAQPKPLKDSRTIHGASIAGSAAVAGPAIDAVADSLKDISGYQEQVMQLMPYFDAMKWALLVVVLAGVAYTIYAKVNDRKAGRA